jgi:DNA-binding CsgD family transcriptional regulator/tetratricopeptide (TPR) repeat protein
MLRELLEREEPVAALDAVLAGVRSGRGRALVIEGPAGVGKTALLDAARERAEGLMVLRAGGGEFERDVALGVLRQLFEPALWRATDSQRARWLRGPSEIAGRLFGVGGSAASAQGLAMDEAAVRSGFYWLAVALAEDSPLVLLIDDLHWVDPESLRWRRVTVRQLQDTGIALIAATRAAEPGVEGVLVEALARVRGVELLRPLPLSGAGTERFVRAWPGFESAAPEFAAACHELSGGNPFLLAELLGEAARVGVGPGGEDATRLRALVPQGLARTVLLRLRPLGAAAVGLARAVAVMGSGARLAEAAAVADLSVGSAVSQADALVRAGVVRDGQELQLVHPLVRAAILSDLTAAARAALHARAARVLAEHGASAERVAAHLLFATPCVDQWVVDRLLAAAEEARASGAPETAVRLLQRALAEPPAGSARTVVHAALGSARCSAGDPGGIENVELARNLSGDSVERAMLALRVGTPYVFLGRGREVEAMFRTALVELGDNSPMLSFALRTFCASMTAFGAQFDLGPLLPELLEWAKRLSSPAPIVRQALAALAVNAYRAAFPAAVVVATARRAIGDLAEHRAAIEEGIPLFPALVALALADEPAELEERLALAERGVRERGSFAFGWANGLSVRAMLAIRGGSLEAAVDHARAAVDLTGEGAFTVPRAGSLVLLAAALRERGELLAAEAALAELPPAEASGIWAAEARRELAAIALARGENVIATREALAAGGLFNRAGEVNPVLGSWRSTAALALRAVGETDRAAALAVEQLKYARAFGAPGAVGSALRIQGLVLDEPDLLADAERALAGSLAHLDHARTLIDLGAALRRRGARARSREPLLAGMEAAHRCGARPLVESALTELRAAGARPRSVVRIGVAALTPSERRIAELAAAGRSNREIAGELFVTKATVETHLRSIFRKLDVGSRDELGNRLIDDKPAARVG